MNGVAPFPAGALPPGASTESTEVREYAGNGGTQLRYRIVAAPDARHTLLYLHGIESHGGWFLPAAQRLRERGCTTYLVDRRGSGMNRATAPGDAANADVLLEDVRRFREAIGDPPLHVVGLSWGGKLATAAALDHPERVTSLVLVTPGLRARVDLRPLQKLSVGLDLLRGGTKRFPVPLHDELFTTQRPLLDFLADDPLRTTEVTARFLWASRALDRRIARGIARLRVPVLLLLADDDRIVDNGAVLRLLSALPEGALHLRTHARAMHSIQLERTDDMVSDIVSFLEGVRSPW